MKKLVCLLVLTMVVPAFAQNTITITGADDGGGVLRIDYAVSGGSVDAPVGISLNFACSDGATAGVGAVTYADPCFPVYLDYASEDPCNYNFDPVEGTPLAIADAAGVPDLAVETFALCMGRLDPCDVPKDGQTRVLAKIQLTQGTAASTDVTIATDDLRGGTVGSVFDVTIVGSPTTVSFGGPVCFEEGWVDGLGNTITAANVAQYVASGSPACWCYPCFAAGDGNNDCVNTTGDLFMVMDPISGAFKPYGDGCADFNYDGVITTGDLFIVMDPITGVFKADCVATCP